LYGAHINTHKWKETDPISSIALGLPVEGILERKDHPYHDYVKEKYASSPIQTHLIGEVQDKLKEEASVHRFLHDRHYGVKISDLFSGFNEDNMNSLGSNQLIMMPMFDSMTTTEVTPTIDSSDSNSNERASEDEEEETVTTIIPTTTEKTNSDSNSDSNEVFVPPDILAKYFASDSNQVLHPLLDPAILNAVHPNTPAIHPHIQHQDIHQRFDGMGPQVYPTNHAAAATNPSMTAFIAMNPLPVFAPVQEDKTFAESNKDSYESLINAMGMNGNNSFIDMTDFDFGPPTKSHLKPSTNDTKNEIKPLNSWIRKHTPYIAQPNLKQRVTNDKFDDQEEREDNKPQENRREAMDREENNHKNNDKEKQIENRDDVPEKPKVVLSFQSRLERDPYSKMGKTNNSKEIRRPYLRRSYINVRKDKPSPSPSVSELKV